MAPFGLTLAVPAYAACMTSVRLGDELEAELAEAADAMEEIPSAFIRAAVRERLDRISAKPVPQELAFMIGVVRTGTGSNARHSGRAFKKLLASKGKSS